MIPVSSLFNIENQYNGRILLLHRFLEVPVFTGFFGAVNL